MTASGSVVGVYGAPGHNFSKPAAMFIDIVAGLGVAGLRTERAPIPDCSNGSGVPQMVCPKVG